MIWGRESKSEKLKKKVKEDYDLAVSLAESPARDNRVFCVRVALKCRANIDAAFAKAASEIERYEELAMIAIAKGSEAPAMPLADAFQLVKSGEEFAYTYIPERSAEKIFALGAAYQTLKISRAQAIAQTQAVADQLWLDLGLAEPFEVLRFLRDEEREEGSTGTDSAASDKA
jgi:hypothetical protein